MGRACQPPRSPTREATPLHPLHSPACSPRPQAMSHLDLGSSQWPPLRAPPPAHRRAATSEGGAASRGGASASAAGNAAAAPGAAATAAAGSAAPPLPAAAAPEGGAAAEEGADVFVASLARGLALHTHTPADAASPARPPPPHSLVATDLQVSQSWAPGSGAEGGG